MRGVGLKYLKIVIYVERKTSFLINLEGVNCFFLEIVK